MTTLQDFLNTSTQVLQSVTITEEQYIEESAVKCEQIVTELPTVTFRLFFSIFVFPFKPVILMFCLDARIIAFGAIERFMFGWLVS